MKILKSINRRRLLIFIFALLLLNAVFFFWMRDLIREVFVMPLSYLFYLGGIFVDSTSQFFFWAGIVVISILIASRSLNQKQKRMELSHLGRQLNDRFSEANGRVSYWLTKLNILGRYQGSYFMGGFHPSLSRLLVELLAHRNHLTTSQVEDRIRSGSLDLPEDVQGYLLSSLNRPEVTLGNLERFWQRILTILRRWLPRPLERVNDNVHADHTLQRIEFVIQFMEEELEISHEHPSQSSR